MTPLEHTLTATVQTLNETIKAQAHQIDTQTHQIEEQALEIKRLSAQIAYLLHKLFGKSSEKKVEGVPSLFDFEDEAGETEKQGETIPDNNAGEGSRDDKAPGKKKTSKRLNHDNLPILERRELLPEGLDLSRYRRIGEEVTYQVAFKPGMLYRIEIVRPKFGLKDSTEPVERGQGVLIAPMPLLPINKGMADSSLLTEILMQKYEYHVPFYRQIKQFAHLGMEGIKEATMTGWFQRTMELLRPLYDLQVAEVMVADYIQADETTVPVINKEKHAAEKEYLWMVRSVMEKNVVFFYDDGSRGGDVIKTLTDKHKFKGWIQCDGFSGYRAAYKLNPGVRLVHCMVHIRREMLPVMQSDSKQASWFLSRIKTLYAIEHHCDEAGMDFESRKQYRQEKAKPLMEEMQQWLEKVAVDYSPQSPLGKAAAYAYNRWENMKNYLEDGRLLLDNNLAENEIRPVTLGRKNYLFCGNHKSAEDMCVVLSLLSTCRNHDINPRLYLNDVIARMPYLEHRPSIEKAVLLPQRWILDHPEARMGKIREMAK